MRASTSNVRVGSNQQAESVSTSANVFAKLAAPFAAEAIGWTAEEIMGQVEFL